MYIKYTYKYIFLYISIHIFYSYVSLCCTYTTNTNISKVLMLLFHHQKLPPTMNRFSSGAGLVYRGTQASQIRQNKTFDHRVDFSVGATGPQHLHYFINLISNVISMLSSWLLPVKCKIYYRFIVSFFIIFYFIYLYLLTYVLIINYSLLISHYLLIVIHCSISSAFLPLINF